MFSPLMFSPNDNSTHTFSPSDNWTLELFNPISLVPLTFSPRIFVTPRGDYLSLVTIGPTPFDN
jgi:hypothetical protein